MSAAKMNPEKKFLVYISNVKTASCIWSSTACALTYDYVKAHPERPAPHDLSASQSEAARSESVGPEAALGYNRYASLIQQAQTSPFHFINLMNLMTSALSCFAEITSNPGSSSFITDATGYAVQHLQYLPFGETFVDQQNGYDSRYTFSAKEKDDETQYSYFGARYYDSDLSVWLSVDPMAKMFPGMSPYMYCGGNPVVYFDPDGNYKIPTDKLEEYRKKYPETMKYIENQLKNDVMGCQKMLDAYMEISNNTFTADKVEEAFTMGSGPNFAIVENPGGFVWSTTAHGYYDDYSNTIEINQADVAKAEKVLQTKASLEDKRVAFMGVFKTILHETAEYANTNQSSTNVPKEKHVPGIEPGYTFENKVWGSGVYNAPAFDMYDPYTARNVIRQQIIFDEENTLPTLE